MAAQPGGLSCPSAQPDMEDARVIGILSGEVDAPRIAYLKADARIDPADLPDLGPLEPIQVFRFAARCEEGRCAQFREGRCSLGARIVAGLDPVVDALPSCQIRSTCRWHAEEGRDACLRCPQVVTLVPHGEGPLAAVASRPPDEERSEGPTAR